MSNAIHHPIPVAPYDGLKIAAGHVEAFTDLNVAADLGLLESLQGLTVKTRAGWVVTDAGRAALASKGLDGLARRQAVMVGREVDCPSWCRSDHPRKQLAVSSVMHTATEVSAPWGLVWVGGVDSEGTCTAPEVDAHLEERHEWTPADLREAGAAFLRVADEFERLS